MELILIVFSSAILREEYVHAGELQEWCVTRTNTRNPGESAARIFRSLQGTDKSNLIYDMHRQVKEDQSAIIIVSFSSLFQSHMPAAGYGG